MEPVILITVGGSVSVGYSGKQLGSVQTPGRQTNANFEEFLAHFPDKIVYDMPAVGKDHIVEVDGLSPEQVWSTESDALITESADVLLTLRAADCIPLVFYVPGQKILGLAHVGTSGAALHLPRKMTVGMGLPASDLHIYVGPHISQKSYRFNTDQFEKKLNHSWDKYIAYEADGVHIDLLNYVLDELKAVGIKAENIKVNQVDTGADKAYFSHRRHKLTGEADGRNCFGVCLI